MHARLRTPARSAGARRTHESGARAARARAARATRARRARAHCARELTLYTSRTLHTGLRPQDVDDATGHTAHAPPVAPNDEDIL
eukprot:3528035-Pleurochrysis_carterae.AAC.1